MSDLERVAVGIRQPDRENIEYAIVTSRGADGLLPVLRKDYHRRPRGIFNELAAERRRFRASDGVDFHQAVRAANASRWYIHQTGGWDGGPVKPPHHQSLLTRWYHAAAGFGGDRFHPRRSAMGGSYIGIRRHCIMGMLVELFLDDYPGAVATIAEPPVYLPSRRSLGSGYFKYETFNPLDISGLLPAIVQRETGLADNRGSFELDDRVVRILEEGYRVPVRQLQESGVSWNLVSLNDSAMNWPIAAELIALPAPGLFVNVRTC